MSADRILIVGAGDHGRVVLDLLAALGWPVAGFVEPAGTVEAGRTRSGTAVLGSLDDPASWLPGHGRFVVALGSNRRRREAWERCLGLGLEPAPAAVHPTATILGGVVLAPGVQVCARAFIGLEARIEEDCLINTGAQLDHDARIGPHATVAPGAILAGRVTVEPEGFVGMGAVIREGVTVGAGALVAAGAVVVRDVPTGTRVAGVPARPMDSEAPTA